MSPRPGPPSMIIMGNSVPPPSIRWTLVICGQANLPYSESSQASARPNRRLLPSRVTLNRHTGRANHLVRSQVQHHVVARELAVELSCRIEWMVLPSILVVHDDFRIPLRKIEPPALASLAARQ